VNAKLRNSAEPDPIDVEVGQRLRVLRRTCGVTQAGLAEALGLSFQQIQKYERGYNRISASVLVRCARALKCSVGELVGEEADDRSAFDATAAASISEHERAEFLRVFVRVPSDERRVLIRLMTSIARPEREPELTVRQVG
jgi:transcriptional regulator with XRE-family HTH domain